MLALRKNVVASSIGAVLLLFALIGCSHTPKYTYRFTNNCGFPIFVGMHVEGQGTTAGALVEIWPGATRKYVVFSETSGAGATLVVDSPSNTTPYPNTRNFPVGTGDVDHAPDSSRPFESVIDGELCEGLDSGAGG